MLTLIKQTATSLLITAITLTCFTFIAHAQDPDPATTTGGQPPVPTSFSVNQYLDLSDQGAASFGTGENQISNIVAYLIRGINFLSLAIGSFAFLAIVIGGFLLVTSGGQEAQLQRGKDIIKFAIIGVIVAMISYFLVAFIQSVVYEYGS